MGHKTKGSTLFVTLEPCCHQGRTPPCTKAIIAAGIKEVVIAAKDANPLVGGKGIKALERAGIKVTVGIRADVAEAFYQGFFFAIKHKRPLIILKIAQSLDGKINSAAGIETAITSEESKAWVHAMRAHVDAVLIGGKTLRIDNPQLTPRKVVGPVPEAIVVSRRGPFPLGSHLFAKNRKAKTLVLAEDFSSTLPDWVGQIKIESDPVATLLKLFEKQGYHSVLVEGGPEIWSLLINAGLCDSLFVLTAPVILANGERWDTHLTPHMQRQVRRDLPQHMPQDWGKALKFRNFATLGKDFLVEFVNSKTME